MLVGREKEIKQLNELYNSDSAELVALYGRRRVGKTYLIDETFEGRITFRHSGLSPIDDKYASDSARKSRMKDQLKHFHQSLISQGMKNGKVPESWLDAFYMLEQFLLEKEKDTSRLLIFFDEIQWLDTPKSGFMTGFEAFWNGWACHKKNVMVIVCGSSSSWVLNKVINSHGGLYDRVTYQINLLPFTLAECEKYFETKNIIMSRYDVVKAYMAFGGIPYYFRYFKKEYSLIQNINEIYFVKDAPLKNEYDRLFSSLFSNPEIMKQIVEAISTKNMGLTRKEIIEITGISNSGVFTQYLDSLISGNFIMQYKSFKDARDTYYKLIDSFCIFYLKFVKENKISDWNAVANTQSVVSWEGLAFENVCFNHIKQIKASLGISGVSTEESLWSKRGDEQSQGTQIDLIINRKDNVVNMCEAKLYSDEFAIDKEYHFTLIRRNQLLSDVIPKKATVHNTLITTYGLKHNEYYGDFINVITLDDLFA